MVEAAFRFGEPAFLAPAIQPAEALVLADSPAAISNMADLFSDHTTDFPESAAGRPPNCQIVVDSADWMPQSGDRMEVWTPAPAHFSTPVFEHESDFYLESGPDSGVTRDADAVSIDPEGNGPRHHWNELAAESAVSVIPDYVEDDVADDSDEVHPPNFDEANSSPDLVAASVLEDCREQPEQKSAEATADVTGDMLEQWDYSRNTWPVLVAPAKKVQFARPRVSIIVLALLLAGAGGLYLLFNQIASRAPQASEPGGSSASTRVVAKPAGEPASPATEAQIQPNPPGPGNSTVAAPKPAHSNGDVTNETDDAQFRFALQAAAFPTQAGADEFAERLKRAGVASYVVNTNLVRRGKWYRVRVGRFKTAEDAQAFAREAQAQSKAAGISLQLIVCPYERP